MCGESFGRVSGPIMIADLNGVGRVGIAFDPVTDAG